MGASGEDRVHLVANWIPNIVPGYSGSDIVETFKKKYNDDYYTAQTYVGMQLMSEAIKQSKSTDPVKVAFAMSGMKLKSINGEIEMRATDHQLQQNVYIATWSKMDGKAVKYDFEKTGYGWKQQQMLPAYVAAQPTSCQMKRPPKP
jgi:branched-chain amino acid transport system substrate-binding protein